MMTMITSMRKPVGMLDRDNFANHDLSKIKKDPDMNACFWTFFVAKVFVPVSEICLKKYIDVKIYAWQVLEILLIS